MNASGKNRTRANVDMWRDVGHDLSCKIKRSLGKEKTSFFCWFTREWEKRERGEQRASF